MKIMRVRHIKSYLADDRGSTAVEYGIIVTAMFGAIIPAFIYVASGMTMKFSEIAEMLGSSSLIGN